MISSLGQARIRLMAKGGTTNLIIIFPAFHSICPLSSLGGKLQNRLPMYMITCFQFTLPSIVLQRQWPISQTHTWECRAPFLLLTATQWKLRPEERGYGCCTRSGGDHTVLNSLAWKDLRHCLFFQDNIWHLICSAIVPYGCFNHPLNHNSAGGGREGHLSVFKTVYIGWSIALLPHLHLDTSTHACTHTSRYSLTLTDIHTSMLTHSVL